MTDAVKEYYVQNARLEKGEKPQFTDVMQCFCTHQDENGVDRSEAYTAEVGGQKRSLKICSAFYADKLRALFFGYGITGVIIVVNEVLRLAII